MTIVDENIEPHFFTSDKDLVSINYMLTNDLIKVHTNSLSKLETSFKNHYFIVITKFSRTLNHGF
jgi:hypothetical protein